MRRDSGRPPVAGQGRVFRLLAYVNARGGTMALSQSEGAAGRVSDLVEQEVPEACAAPSL